MVEARANPNLKEQNKVWLRPLGVSSGDWTEGTIVGVHKRLFRRCQIRISFAADLPYEVFKPMVFGEGTDQTTADREAPEHEKDTYWR
jgi:hypothetical protein